ncbi:hypothetical protein PG993_010577 [Apiospora rasikravindrae]|uniref:Uncharacterized protein n=1 Tax=Apiospora rasikravindrae TaxID=990691 RepID=A0ABR1SMM2_9PEZI
MELVDSALDDVHKRAEAVRGNSGVNGAVATQQQQQTDSPFGSTGTAHTWNSTSTAVSLPNQGAINNSNAVLSPTDREDGEIIEEEPGTKATGPSSKEAATGRGGQDKTWEAFVATELEKMDRRRALKKSAEK